MHEAEKLEGVSRMNIIKLCDKPLGMALTKDAINRAWRLVCETVLLFLLSAMCSFDSSSQVVLYMYCSVPVRALAD
jgi:hypothetical protein